MIEGWTEATPLCIIKQQNVLRKGRRLLLAPRKWAHVLIVLRAQQAFKKCCLCTNYENFIFRSFQLCAFLKDFLQLENQHVTPTCCAEDCHVIYSAHYTRVLPPDNCGSADYLTKETWRDFCLSRDSIPVFEGPLPKRYQLSLQ